MPPVNHSLVDLVRRGSPLLSARCQRGPLLTRWGVPTVVLDRRPARDAVGSKAICQQRDVLDVWEAVGAGARIAAEGVTWTTARTFHRGTELFHHTFADAGHPAFPPFVWVVRPDAHVAAAATDPAALRATLDRATGRTRKETPDGVLQEIR